MTWTTILAALMPIIVALEPALMAWLQTLLNGLLAKLSPPATPGAEFGTNAAVVTAKNINVLFDAAQAAAPPLWRFWQQPLRKRIAISTVRQTALAHAAECANCVVLSPEEVAALAKV